MRFSTWGRERSVPTDSTASTTWRSRSGSVILSRATTHSVAWRRVADDLEIIEEPPPTDPASSEEPASSRKRPSWMLPALLFVVVAIVATGVTVLLTRDDE